MMDQSGVVFPVNCTDDPAARSSALCSAELREPGNGIAGGCCPHLFRFEGPGAMLFAFSDEMGCLTSAALVRSPSQGEMLLLHHRHHSKIRTVASCAHALWLRRKRRGRGGVGEPRRGKGSAEFDGWNPSLCGLCASLPPPSWRRPGHVEAGAFWASPR